MLYAQKPFATHSEPLKQASCSALEQQHPNHGPGYHLSMESPSREVAVPGLGLQARSDDQSGGVAVRSSFLAAYVSELEMLNLVINYLHTRT